MAKVKKKVNHNNEKSTWQNTAKEQPYLMPGTAEYEEYKDDLQEHNPFRPDDEWHNVQEKNNDEHGEKISKKAEEAINPVTSRQKAIKQRQKADLFSSVKQRAVDNAMQTEDKSDDKKASRLLPKDLDDIVYNDGITEDEVLPKALRKYE